MKTAALPGAESSSPVVFVDVAREAGLTAANVWGGVKSKKYIIEAKGSGLAFFDYDQDGWLDIYLTNGSRLDETWLAGQAPTTHL
ncbi:MAG: RNA-binding protein, partial [Acidobacteria bacterium]